MANTCITSAYLECAKGGAQEVWGTQVPEWGPVVKLTLFIKLMNA